MIWSQKTNEATGCRQKGLWFLSVCCKMLQPSTCGACTGCVSRLACSSTRSHQQQGQPMVRQSLCLDYCRRLQYHTDAPLCRL